MTGAYRFDSVFTVIRKNLENTYAHSFLINYVANKLIEKVIVESKIMYSFNNIIL